MASRRNVRYTQLPTDEDDRYGSYDDNDGIKGRRYDPRFDYTPRSLDKVPWKSIALALFLLLLGSLLLFLSFFILTGHMGGDSSQAYGLLALGVLTFLPAAGRMLVAPVKEYQTALYFGFAIEMVIIFSLCISNAPFWLSALAPRHILSSIILFEPIDFMRVGSPITRGGVPKVTGLLPSPTIEPSA